MVEQATVNRPVAGSTPASRANASNPAKPVYINLVERRGLTPAGASSNLATGSNASNPAKGRLGQRNERRT